MKNVLAALVCAGVVAGPAAAQVPIFNTSTAPYVPLTLTSAGFTNSPVTFASSDDSGTVVTLPFAFPWFGASYPSVLINTNGFVSFDTSSCTGSGCYTNTAIPGAGSPSNAIFAWWDDNSVSASTVTTHSSAAEFVIQYSNLTPLSATGSYNFQVRLSPSGTVVVHYGSMTGTAEASIGFENSTGTLGAAFVPSGTGTCTSQTQTGCCSAGTTFCRTADIPSGFLVRIGEPNEADLVVPAVTISNLTVQPTGNWSFDLDATIRNYGRTAADNFNWRAFISTDRVIDASDLLVAQGGPISIGPTTSTTITASAASASAPPTGAYYVLVEADSTGVVMEASEVNNTGATVDQYVSGTDLVASSISGVANSGGGNTDNLQVNFYNRGTVAAGQVSFCILLSANNTLDASDFPLGTFTRTVTGGQTINEAIPVTMPANTPNGEFFYILEIDPGNAITEANELNNVAVSGGKVTVRRADLIADAMDVVDPVTGAPTRTARFGEPIRITGMVSNPGGANAVNFNIAAIISTDANLSLLSDTVVCEQVVVALNSGTSRQSFTMNCTLPLNGADARPLPTAQYFFFFAVDSRGQVFESLETNNNLYVGPIRVTAPGADLAVSNVTAPAAAGVGEIIPVSRTIRNAGNVDAPTATYRYFASANDIITANDIPLQIVAQPGAQPSDEGNVTLARGAGDTSTELLVLPGTMPAGAYYIGCIVDPTNVLSDLDRTNNGRASRVVQVAASSLRIVNTVLPDSTVGRSYAFRLAAIGEEGASNWVLSGQPAWLTIGAADGLLSGTPSGARGAEVIAFTVTLTNGTRTSAARLVMRTLPPTTQVEITSVGLPAVVNSSSVPFTYALGAAGGVRPYQWRIAAGGLPSGLSLSADGVITGAPRGTPNGTSKFTVEVRDASGGRSQHEFQLRLVAPGSITIGKIRLPDGIVGGDYLEDIAVANADGSPFAKPLVWRLSGSLPDGLALTEQTEISSISGRPGQAGLFSFTLSVEDASGRSDSMDYVLVIHPPRYKVIGTMPELLRPLQSDVSVQFSVAPANNVIYSVAAGALPPGLTLSSSGLVSGALSSEADGQWNFVIEAKDRFGASGLGAFSARVEREPRKQGCSATDSAPFAMMALATMLARRRGARAWLSAVAALALVLPSAALAQYQVVGPAQTSFQPLGSAGQPVGQTVTPGGAITLPFDFPFYTTRVNTLGFSAYGYVAIGGSTATDSSNETIPHSVTSTFSARAFIAPWWDSLGTSGATYKFAVAGAAPARVAIIEWGRVPAVSGSTTLLSFQVRLFEGSGRIQFVYDSVVPSAASASVGIQGELGNGVPGLTCSATSSCGASNYLLGSSLDFYLPPDLEIASLSVPQTGYAGVAFPVTATVRNGGGRQAANVDVTFYLSTDAVLDVADITIGTATSLAVEAGQTAQVTSTASLPTVLSAANYFVIAVVDAANAIAERNETNNASSAVATSIGAPTPDLIASAFTAPATAHPGAMVQVSRSIRNTGNAPAVDFKYSYFLSDNSVVTVSDRALSPVGQIASLAAGATDTAMDTLALPAMLAPGNYWLGVCANYDSGSSRFGPNEITIVNNCITSLTPLQVSTTELTVSTSAVPAATQYAPYGLRLQATGGTGQYSWEVAAGSMLPTGLSLTPQGDLQGAPARTGTFAFDVKVSSGTLSATRNLSLMVAQGSLPLVIVDQALAAAEFGRAYNVPIIAVGGKPPYTWKLTQEMLPAGLALASDGTIEGRANASGDFTFPVEVTDSAGATAAKELSVKVVTPSALSVATRALPEGTLNREYLQPLVAVGGRAPYAWSIEQVQQLAENATEQPGEVIKDAAAVAAFITSLGLAVDDGNTQDFLRGVPRRAGLFVMSFKVVDGAGTEDRSTVLLHVGYVDGLAITTTMLPDAFLNHAYGPLFLSHNGGRDAEGLSFSVPCIKQAIRAGSETRPPEFACAAVDSTQMLPGGMVLGVDGSLTGTPAAIGTYTFLVKVTDATNRQDVRSLSIRVRPEFKTQSGGCSGVPFAPSLLALVSALALGLRRRRTEQQS